jgi:hypothetical protein
MEQIGSFVTCISPKNDDIFSLPLFYIKHLDAVNFFNYGCHGEKTWIKPFASINDKIAHKA